MQIWAEPGKIGPAHSQLFTNLISVFNVYTKLETVSHYTSVFIHVKRSLIFKDSQMLKAPLGYSLANLRQLFKII